MRRILLLSTLIGYGVIIFVLSRLGVIVLPTLICLVCAFVLVPIYLVIGLRRTCELEQLMPIGIAICLFAGLIVLSLILLISATLRHYEIFLF